MNCMRYVSPSQQKGGVTMREANVRLREAQPNLSR
jgi:hypothetical protein